MKLIFKACPGCRLPGCRSGGAWLVAILGLVVTHNAGAFSLLGPYADWMDVQKGYRQPGDFGGPMNAGEGYRWNVPVVSYGFDPSFVAHFGTNGVAAVDAAAAVLNQVPATWAGTWQDYRTRVWLLDDPADALCLQDLKTRAITLLLQQMGLADSVRYAFCVRDFYLRNQNPADCEFYIINRNFDPSTARPSPYINSMLLNYIVYQRFSMPTPDELFCCTDPFHVDQSSPFLAPATTAYSYDFGPCGVYLLGLSQDDVAGLHYLLNPNQVRWENLLPDVHLAAPATGPFVCAAFRPGLGKINLVRHPVDPLNGQFQRLTNRWTDIYLGVEAPAYQEVERVTTRPDILFTAADLGPHVRATRTSTSNWWNHADLNGNYGGAGPGIIQPPITIAFNSGQPYPSEYGLVSSNAFLTEEREYPVLRWGSYDGTTNPPMIYPGTPLGFTSTEVQFRLRARDADRGFHWSLSARVFERFFLQTATNFTAWETLSVLTNTGVRTRFEYRPPTNEPGRFFRMVPERARLAL